MNEEWKSLDFIGYPNYEISNYGNLKSCNRIIKKGNGYGTHYIEGRIIKQSVSGSGYLFAELNYNKNAKKYLMHRLVAMAFLPNYNNKTDVNHLDGNKLNNNLKNLEWCTHKENSYHYYKNNVSKNSPKKIVKKMNDAIIATYESSVEAAKLNGGNTGCIIKCCKGERKTHKGYEWAYAEEVMI